MKKFLLELRSPSRTGRAPSHHLVQVDHCHLGNNEGEDEGDSEDDHYHSGHMGRERVFSEKKSSITSVKLFGMGKVSGITKKNFKIGTLEDFEKTYVLYVAMAEKPLSSGQKWFLR